MNAYFRVVIVADAGDEDDDIGVTVPDDGELGSEAIRFDRESLRS